MPSRRAGRGVVRGGTGARLPAIAVAVGVAAAGLAAEPVVSSSPRAQVSTLLKDTASLVRWVEEHSPEVAAADARVLEARADVGTSRLVPNPELTVGLSDVAAGTTNPPGLGFHDTATYDLGVTETVEIGKRGPRIRSARLTQEAVAEARLDALAQKVAEARHALGRLVHLGARQAVLRESLESARRSVDLDRVRLEQGEVSGNDHDRLVLDTLSLELDGERNRAEYEEALAECRAALRAPCDVEGSLPEDLDAGAELPPIGDDVETWLARRPDVAALERQRESALEDRRLARRRAIPDPSLGLTYTRDYLTLAGNQPRTIGFAVGVPLPIFDHGQYDAAKAGARASEMEASAEGARVRARADLDALLSRRAQLEEAIRRLDAEAVPKSAAILDTTLKAFEQGEMSMTDLLLARRTHTALLLNRMDVRFEYFSVRNEIRRALGLDAETARRPNGAAGG